MGSDTRTGSIPVCGIFHFNYFLIYRLCFIQRRFVVFKIYYFIFHLLKLRGFNATGFKETISFREIKNA